MDAALYEKLLEDLRSDLTQAAPMLEELESVRSFLQRRMESVTDKNSYQKVLDDIAGDFNHKNEMVEELKRIDRFVSSRLGKPSFDPDTVPRAQKPKPEPKLGSPPKPEPAPEPPAAKKPPVSKPAAKVEEKKEDKKPAPSLAELPGSSSGMTIEFGPDGFPVHSPLGKSAGKERSEARGPVAEGSGMDGATINFGPDGFPVDFPKPVPKKK